MNYLKYDLNRLKVGAVVRVMLSSDNACVRLLDLENYEKYKRGHHYEYYGDDTNESPVYISVPHTGEWHLVVDLCGGIGEVNVGVEVIP